MSNKNAFVFEKQRTEYAKFCLSGKDKNTGISHKNENDGSKVERRKDTQEKEKLQNDKSNKKAREKGAPRL